MYDSSSSGWVRPMDYIVVPEAPFHNKDTMSCSIAVIFRTRKEPGYVRAGKVPNLTPRTRTMVWPCKPTSVTSRVNRIIVLVEGPTRFRTHFGDV